MMLILLMYQNYNVLGIYRLISISKYHVNEIIMHMLIVSVLNCMAWCCLAYFLHPPSLHRRGISFRVLQTTHKHYKCLWY